MARGIVVDPTARRGDAIFNPGLDAGLLAGKRLGFRLEGLHSFGTSRAQTKPIAAPIMAARAEAAE